MLGGITAERVLAAGESQSAFRMVTYLAAVHPIEPVYDGFLVHSRFGSGAAISQAPLADHPFPAPAPIRDDLDVPVMVGGAPVTQNYADEIGAQGYAADAASAVDVAKVLLKGG